MVEIQEYRPKGLKTTILAENDQILTTFGQFFCKFNFFRHTKYDILREDHKLKQLLLDRF